MSAPEPDLAVRLRLRRLADAAAGETLPRFRAGLQITNKDTTGAFDPVTEADRAAERAIREVLTSECSEDAILGEEFGARDGTSGRRWIIDPVDGTRAFICGVPVWTTLVGVEDHGTPIAGLISQPFTGETWIAADGRCVYAGPGGRAEGRTSGCADLATARLMVTDLRADGYFSADECAGVASIAREVRVCRQGLDGYGFGLVASGHLDLVIEAGLSWYDIAGPLAVIEAAGGTVVSWTGEPVREGFEGGRIIAAAKPQLAEAVVARLRDVT